MLLRRASQAMGRLRHRVLLGLADETPPHLRWISPQHQLYLAWHRQHVFQS